MQFQNNDPSGYFVIVLFSSINLKTNINYYIRKTIISESFSI